MFGKSSSELLCICLYLLYFEHSLGNPTLTSVNFRSVLEWKTEVQKCDIELKNGSLWLPLSMAVTCERGSCSADLSSNITDIYQIYQARVKCPHGDVFQWHTSNKMQLYKDVKVGPPVLNVSLGISDLTISAMLPVAPWRTNDCKPYPVQRIISNLRYITINVTIGSHTSYKIDATLMDDNMYRNSVRVPHFPGADYCVTATPKTHNNLTVKKCLQGPEAQMTHSVATGVSICLVIILVSVVLIIWRFKFLTITMLQPKVLEFSKSCIPAMVAEELSPSAILSLVPLKNKITTAEANTFRQCRGYEQNGLFVHCEQQIEADEKNDLDFLEEACECNEDNDYSSSESFHKYPQPHDTWINTENINLNSVWVMDLKAELCTDEVTVELANTTEEFYSSSEVLGMDCNEEELETWNKLQILSGYEQRTTLVTDSHSKCSFEK